MVTGRPRKSAAVKEASGAYAKNPQRRNQTMPEAKEGWPTMPALVKEDKEAADIWNQAGKLLEEMNLLTTSHVYLLTALAINGAAWRRLSPVIASGVAEQVDVTLYKFSMSEERKILSELGLTPTSRERLHVVKTEEEDNPFQVLQMKLGS